MDFAGPFLGQHFLIVVDAFSKWLEVESMGNITARATIKKLQLMFAIHGIPEVVVTDTMGKNVKCVAPGQQCYPRATFVL